ncbi:glycosyltransferase family 2 protein [Candidatus Berkelbacteria bacterium]|nr:glycosyltransferase family 2 protein [Candidatus Berkelbacteria bacterium]
MKRKKISVVITTYNRAPQLLKCVDSVIGQDYPSSMYEIIVVNDCSTDSTKSVMGGISKVHKNIRILSHSKNKGEAGARNTGIKAARGNIIAFIDDDCIAGKGWLSSINHAFVDGVDGVEGITVTKGGKGPFDNYVENLHGGKYMTCNMSYRAPLIKKIGCDGRLRHANRVDSDLAFSVIESGGKLVFSREASVEHSITRGSFRSKLRRKKFFMNDALLYKKHPALYKKDIKFPFEKFTPFYIFLAAASLINPLFLAGLFLAAAIELIDRRWHAGPVDFVKFAVLQSIGSFVIIASVLYGCWKYGSSPRILLPFKS